MHWEVLNPKTGKPTGEVLVTGEGGCDGGDIENA